MNLDNISDKISYGSLTWDFNHELINQLHIEIVRSNSDWANIVGDLWNEMDDEIGFADLIDEQIKEDIKSWI